MNRGDSLIVYSDGVTEAMNNREELYEEERLMEIVRTQSRANATSIMNAMLQSVIEFGGGHEQTDDISIIVSQRGHT